MYYADAEDLPVIEAVYADEQKNYQQPLAVEKQPLDKFYSAEEYHQDYLDKNPDGYCHLPLELFAFARKAKERK
ncbi:MAG: peptide-methionine (S)-S-oxide reductase [Bacteroidaceae bacterium]|nr:peptide-methionine (S)-S-oxide reductase [Bacteroidaceae bacterium]